MQTRVFVNSVDAVRRVLAAAARKPAATTWLILGCVVSLAAVVIAGTTVNGDRNFTGTVIHAGAVTNTGNVDNSSAALSRPFRQGSAAPDAGACDSPSERGGIYLQSGDPATSAAQIWACMQDGATSYAWYPISHLTGAEAPQKCIVGQFFFSTSVPAGQNLYLCTGTDTWTPVSEGGGSAVSIDGNLVSNPNFSTAVPDAGTNQVPVSWQVSGSNVTGAISADGLSVAPDTNGKLSFRSLSSTFGRVETLNLFSAASNLGTFSSVANQVRGFVFVLPYRMTVNHVCFYVAGNTTAANADMGFYALDPNGTSATLVAHSGAVSLNSTGSKCGSSPSPATIGPGVVIGAWGVDNASVTTTVVAGTIGSYAGTLLQAWAFDTTVSFANPLSGGALPATTGTISFHGISNIPYIVGLN